MSPSRVSTEEPVIRPELHEIDAYYDNIRGIAWAMSSGAPTLECSCGAIYAGEDWESAGAGMDEHVAEIAKITS